MDNINTVPIDGDAKTGEKKLVALFKPLNNTTFGQVQTNKNFDDISRNIWDEMQLSTGNNQPANPCETEPFVDEFYTDGIDFIKLTGYLKMNALTIFDYGHFQGAVSYTGSGADPFTGVFASDVYKVIGNVPYEYTDDNGVGRKAKLTGKLNKKICYLEQAAYGLQSGWWFTLDPVNSICIGGLEYYYKGTFALRQEAADTPEKNDYVINNKYRAVVITSGNVADYIALIAELCNNSTVELIKRVVINKFSTYLEKCAKINELIFLYDNMPDFVIDGIRKDNCVAADTLWKHVEDLVSYDDTGLLGINDASTPLIKVLRILGNAELLFKKFSTDQKFVKKIYQGLDSNSEINGQQVSNRIIFSNLLYALCMVNDTSGLANKTPVFKIGSNYKLDANVTGAGEKDDEFFLQQLILVPLEGMDFLPEALWDKEPAYANDTGAMYKPLDQVVLIDTSTREGSVLHVPAIYVKALSDEAEWGDILHNIRLGLDVLAIIAGAVTVATTGNPMVFALAMADIGLAATDLAVQTFRKEIEEMEGGKEFLQTWETIYLVGSLATAGPAIIGSIFKLGNGLIKLAIAAKNFNIKNFVMAIFFKIIIERNIAGFAKGTLKEMLVGYDAVSMAKVAFNLAGITRLQEAGVTVFKLLSSNGEELYLAFYKDQVIAKGAAKEFRNALREIWDARGVELVEKLEAILTRRRIVSLKNVELLGQAPKTGSKMLFDLIDEFGNSMGQLSRSPNGKTLTYKLIQGEAETEINCTVQLLDGNSSALKNFPVYKGENLLFADFNIPKLITDKLSGLGKTMLDDALAYFTRSKKYGNVDGTLNLWSKMESYAEYGGQSINLDQFWKARNAGKSIEKAAFETFSGRWAKAKGFNKVRFNLKNITVEKITLNFIK